MHDVLHAFLAARHSQEEQGKNFLHWFLQHLFLFFEKAYHFLHFSSGFPFSWRPPPPPGSASTAVARKRTQTRSIATFIVQKMCLCARAGPMARGGMRAPAEQLRVLRVLILTLTLYNRTLTLTLTGLTGVSGGQSGRGGAAGG